MKMNFRKQKKEGAILRIRFLSFLRLLCGKKKSFEKCNTKVLNSIKSVLLIFFSQFVSKTHWLSEYMSIKKKVQADLTVISADPWEGAEV